MKPIFKPKQVLHRGNTTPKDFNKILKEREKRLKEAEEFSKLWEEAKLEEERLKEESKYDHLKDTMI